MDQAMATLFEQLRLNWRAYFILSELLFSLDEADDTLRDIHWDATPLLQIRPQILHYQHLLQVRIHRLHFRIIYEIQNRSLP